MCAISSVWFSISPHIKILYACPFSMPNLPFLWIWLLSYRKWLRPPFLSIWQASNGFIMDFYWIIYGRFRIGMIMTEIFLSRWLNSPKWDIPFSSIGDIPFSPDFCFIWDIPYNFIGDTSFILSGISPILYDSIPDRMLPINQTRYQGVRNFRHEN